ncbi:hypothetical protein A3D80_03695 [Candidatus Roizmanbacteria bacterium RIFCSPHIGHO2_02_FULL_40_13b]|uniref:Phage holin family protein n=1 Tax=Candidatus Roizmanbacteria bacterium RIFCSPHIGHO2_01_FULL_39_24 TaxID=1802032 RepID=A0A1F7GJ60_9BACT|nr:MAG: hypothetical protein A2799_04115 [Candidatus Roizmanbacteria bacterium RIFCSPHIGHO2_01_FULL_39_24]OGK27066.1 MAG: hypothetical protein A3D80_03695 [Candidatus Roizmanbacteria bacterium RIFCSPHIGHO2_02_FULL_40_13b]OGK49144.1 MAG: hypothetical protein A3A56_00875 [Candidatus Roizmanbacteria bacterium RIFCSPLOWO2_01_FULL_40_32]OGK56835.1 MAG: hypothetical protein A3H83_01175 [Candidatus Roizmanbacteria bacterium RIFCSPLOWO2_02_FULL_39_8]
MGIVLSLIVNTVSVYVAAWLLASGVKIPDLQTAFVVAIVLALVNTFLKPVLLILTLPINLLTLGLFTFVLNALIIMLVSSLVAGFTVSSFWWALAFSFVLAIVNMVLEQMVK